MVKPRSGLEWLVVLAFVACSGELSTGDVDAGVGDDAEAGGADAGNADALALPDAHVSVPDAGIPTMRVLDFEWQHQETGYWCGPASTRIALSSRIASPPSQAELANFLGTTTNGTDHIGLVVGALNNYLGISWYNDVWISDPPTEAQQNKLKQDILDIIGRDGYPIVANIVAGWRPPFYPSGTIYHYIAVMGYDQGGDTVLIADPAGEGSGEWANVPRTYWIQTVDLGVWIGLKGYTGL